MVKLTEDIIKDMTRRIEEYDTIRPRLDELKFIADIMNDYNVDRKEAIKMVQSVRRLNVLNKK